MSFTTLANNKANLQDVLTDIRIGVATDLVKGIGTLMYQIDNKASGRVLEAALQLFPQDRFEILAAMCVNNENDEVPQMMASTILAQLAEKHMYQFQSESEFVTLSKSVLMLIHYENLRRKGYLEYNWHEHHFDQTDPRAFTRLTDVGQELAQTQLLYSYNGTKQ